MLPSDKFYRSFVLVPCEICVVPYGHGKIAADWNDIPREYKKLGRNPDELSEGYIV